MGNLIADENSTVDIALMLDWYLRLNAIKQSLGAVVSFSGSSYGAILARLLNKQTDFEHVADLLHDVKSISALNSTPSEHPDSVTIFVGYFMLADKMQNLLLANDPLMLIKVLYLYGINFDWEVLYPNDSGQIISLPSYPFAPKSFWVHSHTGETV